VTVASRKRDLPEGSTERPKLTRLEILGLIFRTYAVSLPYVLIFVAVMLIATWVVTELVFR